MASDSEPHSDPLVGQEKESPGPTHPQPSPPGRELRNAKPSPVIVKVFWIVAWSFLIFLTIDDVYIEIGAWLFPTNPIRLSPYLADQIDVPLIIHSVDSKPTFASTFAWWHTSWIPTVPFWRPLTIQTFWLEKHFLTTARYDLWFWVSTIGHFVMLAALTWMVWTSTLRNPVSGRAIGPRLPSPQSLGNRTDSLISDINGPNGDAVPVAEERSADVVRRKAILWLTLWIYAAVKLGGITPVFFSDLFAGAQASVAFLAWKNQPDILADIFVFSCLALVSRHKWWLAIACGFIAVAFKESGWMVWLIAGVLLTVRGDWRRVPAKVYVGAGVVIATLLALRWISGPDVFRGYHQGSNHSWLTRYEMAVGGTFLYSMTEQPFIFTLGMTFVVFSWLRSRRETLAAYIVLIVGFAGSMALQMHVAGGPLDATIVSYLDARTAAFRTLLVLAVYLQVSGAWLALKSPFYRPLWIFATGAALLSAMPFAAAAQVQVHALHQTYAFESMAWATIFVALVDCWRIHLTAYWRALRSTRRKAVSV